MTNRRNNTNNRRRSNRRTNNRSNRRSTQTVDTNRSNALYAIVRRMAYRYDTMGQGAFDMALKRAVRSGRPVPVNPAEVFELVRIYAYAGTLHSQEYFRREREGIAQTCTQNRPYFIVDHIVPHSQGGSLRAENLGIAEEHADKAKGSNIDHKIDYIEVPEDFEIFDKQLQRCITSYTRD